MKKLAWLRRHKQQLALTMIEMLMVLAVVAVISVLGVRYYGIAHEQAQLKNILQDTQTMMDATVEWVLVNPKSSWSSMTHDTLVTDGYLPARFGGSQQQPNAFSAKYDIEILAMSILDIQIWEMRGALCFNLKEKLVLRGFDASCRTLGAGSTAVSVLTPALVNTGMSLIVKINLLEI